MASGLLDEQAMRHHLFASLVALTGCVTHDSGDDVGPPPPTEPAPIASGSYVVTSHLGITVEALLPDPAAELVGTLRDFSVEPGQTLITLADDAGVPAVGTLRDLLPSILEDKLAGWLDDAIGDRVPALAAEIVALAETVLSQVDVESELAIAGTTATHRLVALDLSPAGLDIVLPLGDLPGEITSATTTVRATGASLVIGDHSYAVAYGEYAWQALDAKLGGIRATLGAEVNCPLVAQRVASKCVLSACVGHAAELTSLCERGLDEVVDRAHAKLASFRFDALHLAAGTATLVDDDDDGSADALTGTWTAELNAGQGLRPAPATFTATR